MCGICGFANYRDDELLRKMTSTLVHRGPDEEGFYFSDKVSLGSRRLKIIDLGTGKQPVYNEDGSIVVVFNGEIYNFKEIRGTLIAKGHIFRSKTDTEVLVHLYEEHGEHMFNFLRGMFAFALWDVKKQVFILGRDHFGIKPVFYSLSGSTLFFASELKALLKVLTISKTLDPCSVDDYFTYLYIPSPHTVYKDIFKLPPASYLMVKNGKTSIRRYWQLKKKEEITKISDELIEKIEGLIDESVKEQMVSDVPLGLFLSGGMDSSSILHFMRKNSNSDLKTFTISYKKEKDYDESAIAGKFAALCGARHENFLVAPDITNVIERIALSFDQPFADSSALITFLISHQARKHVTVALTGIGGDEIFGGYPRYFGFLLHGLYKKTPAILRETASCLSKWLRENYGSSNFPGRIKRFLKGGIEDSDLAYKSWVSSLDAAERKGMYSSSFSAYAGSGYGLNGRAGSDSELFEFDLSNYLEGDLLYLADMASMMNSLELRVPFLDLRLVETMYEVPLRLKMKNFRGKSLLRKIMKDRLPSWILGGKKKGFQIPLAEWLAGGIKGFARDIIVSGQLKKSGYLDAKNLEKIYNEHESRNRNFADQIYSVIIFELWYRGINAR